MYKTHVTSTYHDGDFTHISVQCQLFHSINRVVNGKIEGALVRQAPDPAFFRETQRSRHVPIKVGNSRRLQLRIGKAELDSGSILLSTQRKFHSWDIMNCLGQSPIQHHIERFNMWLSKHLEELQTKVSTLENLWLREELINTWFGFSGGTPNLLCTCSLGARKKEGENMTDFGLLVRVDY